jgi:quercetin dioxygenase-like cupin family protein
MIYKKSDNGYKDVAPGLTRKTLTYGEKALLSEFRLAKGGILPAHSHPHEQIGYLVSGKIVLNIDGQDHEFNPGDSWCIAGDAVHSGKILEDAVAVEVFAPVREDYLD